MAPGAGRPTGGARLTTPAPSLPALLCSACRAAAPAQRRGAALVVRAAGGEQQPAVVGRRTQLAGLAALAAGLAARPASAGLFDGGKEAAERYERETVRGCPGAGEQRGGRGSPAAALQQPELRRRRAPLISQPHLERRRRARPPARPRAGPGDRQRAQRGAAGARCAQPRGGDGRRAQGDQRLVRPRRVARYRRDTTFSGRPSYGNTYAAVNAMAGHLNSFGATAPLPKKRLERMVKARPGGLLCWSAGLAGMRVRCRRLQRSPPAALASSSPPAPPLPARPPALQELEDAEKFLARGR